MTNPNEQISTKDWHGEEIFCWYDREAGEKHAGKSEIFVEVSDHRINIVELAVGEDNLEICSVLSASFQEKEEGEPDLEVGQTEEIMVSKGKILGTPNSLGGTLNHLLELFTKERKSKIKRIHLLLPADVLDTKIVEFPKVQKKELKIALENEIALFQSKKFKEKSSIVKSLRLGEIPKPEGTCPQFLLTGMAKESFLKYLHILKELEFICADISSPELLYIYHFNSRGNDESFIFAEISDENLKLYFFYQDILAFIRSVNLEEMGAEDSEAFIRGASAQIEQSMLYFSQQYGDISFDRFILQDKTTQHENTTSRLSSQLGFPIESFEISNFADFSQKLQQKLKERKIHLNAPLYYKVLRERKNKIRMIPREFDDRLQKQIRYSCIGAFLFCWVLVLIIFYLNLSGTVASRQQALNQTPQAGLLSQQEEIEQQYKEMLKKKPIFNRRHKELKELLKKKFAWLRFLNDLYKANGPGISYSRIQFRINRDTKTVTRKARRSLGKDLNRKPRVERILVENLQLEVVGRIDFPYQKALQAFERFKNQLKINFQVESSKMSPAGGGNVFEITLSEKSDSDKKAKAR